MTDGESSASPAATVWIAAVKMLATGLGAGVLLDALVVRSLLVPATVSWLGRWNWWMPEPMRRVLRVREATSQPAVERA